ncbi:MAG: OB-fold protein [Limisphaerales bacterium]
MMPLRSLATALLLTLPPCLAAGTDADVRLRQELEQAQQRIRQLEEENARLRGTPPPAAPVGLPPAVATPATAPAAAGTPAAVTVVTMPPLTEGETVTLDQLIADYRQSQLAADARYQGRRFRVRGTVEQIAKVFAMLQFDVTLRGQDPLARAQAKVTFPGISDVRLTPNGAELFGRRPFKAELPLLRAGEEFEFEGEFEGLEGGVLRFNKAKPVAP